MTAPEGRVVLRRALLVLVLLSGLFLMHGLTANHNPPSPTARATGHMEHSSTSHVGALMDALPRAAGSAVLLAAQHAPKAAVALASQVGADAPAHGMSDSCVAVLVGSVLLVLMLRALARWRRPAPHAPERTGGTSPPAPPPHLTPSLSVLCVLPT